jgi:response regulator RpfG family c-di-GMP phosphodiesterase
MNENILIVDDELLVRELLTTALTHEGFTCHQAANVDSAFDAMKEQEMDLVISDIMMPGRSGVELLRELKQIDGDIAVLMITGLTDTNTAMECIRLGADDYIAKPFSVTRVILTVRNLIERRNLALEKKIHQSCLESKVQAQTKQILTTMQELQNAYNDTLTALVKALDAREKETGSHSERVMNYSRLLATRMGMSQPELEHISKGALLHDIGKIGITDSTLLKPSKLDEREWREIYCHPLVGYDILSQVSFLKAPAEIILNHHERFDGDGYPNGLKGKEIPLGARIFALVDTLDAMTTDRPYRAALPFDAVTDEVIRCRGSQFDPDIADQFLSISRSEWEECNGKKFP